MYCTKCGKELANDARFCTYCGAKVQQEEYHGNNKGFNGGYEEKKRAVQDSFRFEKSSYWIMKESKIVKIVLSVIKWIFIILTLFMILQAFSIFDVIGVIVVGVLAICIVSVLKKEFSEMYDELEREYTFHDCYVTQSDNSLNTYANAQVEGSLRLHFAFASVMKRRKSVKKMSDEEWLDYYIELNSSFSNIDYTKVYEELQRNKDMEQQMQQFQQQQFQQQIMNQQMQDQALQQQLLDQQQQMQQINDNMFH